MRKFAGTPGTKTALILRLLQGLFAAASIASMIATTKSYSKYSAFSFLINVLGWQVIWSFGLAFQDACALVKKKALHDDSDRGFFIILDWATAIFSLGAASSAAGITMLYCNDLGGRGFGQECQKYQLAVALAFMNSITVGLLAIILLWTVAAD